MDRILLANRVDEWLFMLISAAGTTLLLWAIRYVILRRLRPLAARTSTDLDDLAMNLVQNTKVIVFAGFTLVIAYHMLLQQTEALDNVFRIVRNIAIALQIGFWINTVISHGILKPSRDETFVRTLGTIAKGVVWAIIGLLLLDNLTNIEIDTLIASLGIGGIAIALAVQAILGDLFASISILLDKPFVIGDFLVVGDCWGTVENVGWRSTQMRSLSGEQVIFANKDLLDSRIRNYKRMEERRVEFTVGVTYGTPADKLEDIPDIVRSIIESQPDTRFDRVHFASIGTYSLDFVIIYFILTPDYVVYMDRQQAINLALYQRFEQEGIEFAFPTQTIVLDQ